MHAFLAGSLATANKHTTQAPHSRNHPQKPAAWPWQPGGRRPRAGRHGNCPSREPAAASAVSSAAWLRPGRGDAGGRRSGSDLQQGSEGTHENSRINETEGASFWLLVFAANLETYGDGLI